MLNQERIPLIGITGGIASGKSIVANYLREKQYHVIDADKLGHNVLEPDQPSYQLIIEIFGNAIVNKDGTINRRKLGDIVFSDPKQLKKLNQISHPLILQMILKEAQQFVSISRGNIIFLEAAILLESKNFISCNRVWVVEANSDNAISRLLHRNQYTKSEAKSRLDSQMSNKARRKFADVLIENNGTLEELYQKLDKIIDNAKF